MKKIKIDKSEIDLLVEISAKLDRLIGVFFTQGKSQAEQVKILTSQGFSNSEISGLMGKPKGTIDWLRTRGVKKKAVRK